MKYIFDLHIISIILLMNGAATFAGTANEEAAEVLRRCLSGKEGGYKVVSTSVMHLDAIVKGEGKTNPFCLHDTICFMTPQNPLGVRGNKMCRFTDGRCQTLAECARTMKEPSDFGFAESRPTGNTGYVPHTARRCSEVGANDKGIIYADLINAKKASEYKTVCSKNLKCVLPNGTVENLHRVFCPSKGRGTFREADGSSVEIDLCPGANECFDTQIKLPSEQEYLQNIRLVRAQAINETFPHNSNSETTLPGSPVNPTHNRNIDPL